MRWVSLLLLAVLAACVSTSVSDLGDGRHHLAIRAQHSEDSYDLDRADAAQQADKYCRKSGQRVPGPRPPAPPRPAPPPPPPPRPPPPRGRPGPGGGGRPAAPGARSAPG